MSDLAGFQTTKVYNQILNSLFVFLFQTIYIILTMVCLPGFGNNKKRLRDIFNKQKQENGHYKFKYILTYDVSIGIIVLTKKLIYLGRRIDGEPKL